MQTRLGQNTLAHDVARLGPWSGHNIRLPGDVYTMGSTVVGSALRVRRCLQMIADLTGKPWSELRVLDLGCLEGFFGIECACQGARVLGIDIREEHLMRARFAADALGLGERARFERADVRDVTVERYGSFDVVLCFGLLYHLGAEDAVALMRRMHAMTSRLLIIDTHISLASEQTITIDGNAYAGKNYHEHNPALSEAEQLSNPWASFKNTNSFWFTLPSLTNALTRAGFSSVYRCDVPPLDAPPYDRDRITLAAVRGMPVSLKAVHPMAKAWPYEPRREKTPDKSPTDQDPQQQISSPSA